MASSGYGGDGGVAAGCNFRRRRFRVAASTPYDRPVNPSWLSRAQSFFASAFLRNRRPPTEIHERPDQAVEIRADHEDAVDDGFSSLESMLKKKTFTRSEIKHLTELLQSRVSPSIILYLGSRGVREEADSQAKYSGVTKESHGEGFVVARRSPGRSAIHRMARRFFGNYGGSLPALSVNEALKRKSCVLDDDDDLGTMGPTPQKQPKLATSMLRPDDDDDDDDDDSSKLPSNNHKLDSEEKDGTDEIVDAQKDANVEPCYFDPPKKQGFKMKFDDDEDDISYDDEDEPTVEQVLQPVVDSNQEKQNEKSLRVLPNDTTPPESKSSKRRLDDNSSDAPDSSTPNKLVRPKSSSYMLPNASDIALPEPVKSSIAKTNEKIDNAPCIPSTQTNVISSNSNNSDHKQEESVVENTPQNPFMFSAQQNQAEMKPFMFSSQQNQAVSEQNQTDQKPLMFSVQQNLFSVQQNQAAPQNANPFQANNSLSFSLGMDGGDKSVPGRRFIKPKRRR